MDFPHHGYKNNFKKSYIKLQAAYGFFFSFFYKRSRSCDSTEGSTKLSLVLSGVANVKTVLLCNDVLNVWPSFLDDFHCFYSGQKSKPLHCNEDILFC